MRTHPQGSHESLVFVPDDVNAYAHGAVSALNLAEDSSFVFLPAPRQDGKETHRGLFLEGTLVDKAGYFAVASLAVRLQKRSLLDKLRSLPVVGIVTDRKII